MYIQTFTKMNVFVTSSIDIVHRLPGFTTDILNFIDVAGSYVDRLSWDDIILR